MYAIEKGIPTPGRGDPHRRYPIHLLEIGDSYFVPGGNVSARNSAYTAAKRLGIRVRCLTTREGVRVWRIA